MEEGKTEIPAATYQDLAGLIEHALIPPELSEEDIARGCEIAKRYGVASVIVRPSDVDLAVRWMAGSTAILGTVVDYPNGHSTTAAKLYEARDVLRRGAKEIDTVMNTGKLVSRQFQYLETELLQMADACHQSGAVLKVNLASQYLNEELKIVACRILRRAGADYVGASAVEDLALLRTHSREKLKIKITAPAADLEAAQRFRDAGCTRIQLPDPAPVLESWKQKLAAAEVAGG